MLRPFRDVISFFFQMYFHASAEATILFQEWTTSSWQGKKLCVMGNIFLIAGLIEIRISHQLAGATDFEETVAGNLESMNFSLMLPNVVGKPSNYLNKTCCIKHAG